MRYVDRSRTPEPVVFSSAAVIKEMDEAARHFGKVAAAIAATAIASKAPAPAVTATTKTAKKKKKKKTPSFKFKIYSHESIKRALNELFHGKCAYCESRYAHVHPMEVEHWRPKAAVIEDNDGKKVRPYGYYWLAATWTNLLPSCIDCNRERKYNVLTTGKTVSYGKGNWFPVEGKTRATAAGGEVREKPLLLHPCVDRPEKYLLFLPDGLVVAISPATGPTAARAKASIRHYGLNRPELILDRRSRMRLIDQKVKLLENLFRHLRRMQASGSGQVEIIEDLISHEFDLLQHFRRRDQPYSQMARQVIDPFLELYKPSGL